VVYKNEIELIKSVGEKIKHFRLKQNISQEQLSFESGIPRVQIGRIERGETNATLKTLFFISKALDVSITEFLK
jgi:transcriptional regulator with XRE-family HTH domain